jgi:hypothetical protein
MKRAMLALGVLALALLPAGAQDEGDVNQALAKLLTAAKADATRIRGLEFVADVPVKKITQAQFRDKLIKDLNRLYGQGENLGHMEHLLQRLRVLPPKTGFVDLMDRFLSNSVAANYDPFLKRISFLRGFKSHSIMVHELVHALQDQHFNLSQKILGGPMELDRLLALGALAEGDAESVQRHYDTKGAMSLMPLPAVKAFGEQQIERYLKRKRNFPRAIARPFIFQYFGGMLFVETIKRNAGGMKAIDRVWADPPTTTEQVLHPERYLRRDHPTRITPPRNPGGRKILFSNVLGELGVRIVLEAHLGANFPEAAATGWDGDRILLLDNGEKDPSIAWLTVWDTEKDASEFAAAARRMLTIRAPKADMSVDQEKNLTVALEDGMAHVLAKRGRGVVLALGLSKGEFASVVIPLLRSETREIRVRKARFGDPD